MLTSCRDNGTSEKVDRKTLLSKALEAIESLQARLHAVERDRTEPIAIVGLSCRFPGSADPDTFWRLLSGGVDAVKEVRSACWDKVAYSVDASLPGSKPVSSRTVTIRWSCKILTVTLAPLICTEIVPNGAMKLNWR